MKKPLLYPKLAWQGIRKNAETYLPYLLMGILMVGVSYIMNYLTRPALMGALSMGGTTLMVLQMGKIVISVFSVIFLYYCNSFLIRRRMKEFGLYNILGMGKGNIARVMLWETLLTALLVFAGGLLLGLSLSRLVEMALINLLHADYTVPMELVLSGWRDVGAAAVRRHLCADSAGEPLADAPDEPCRPAEK